ncbi:MAG: tripartite tricarboxylate transporter substrate binding protein [Betaproteobacteria bacterium]|nr:tripartite tricarboxylate transporter substrate binding protein [Betaproteobacteria bacterium]
MRIPAGAALLFATATAFAQGFPTKAVTLLVPFAPGGGSDTVARTIQSKLGEKLGQPVLVENRTGASGAIATAAVAKAPPDGHTLFLSWDTHAINPVIMKDLPYDTFRDFVPVTLLARLPLVMGVWSGLPANTMAEFIALAKRQPGKLNYASVGTASSNRLYSEYMHSLAGIELAHIPYKGGGPSIQAMLTGEVAYSLLSFASQKGYFQSGRLKAFAVTGAKRMADLPDVPTLIESGFPGMEVYGWIGIFAPAGTPEAVVARLNRDFIATIQDADVAKRLAAAGVDAVGSTPAELDRWVRSEYDKWSKFVKSSNLSFKE